MKITLKHQDPNRDYPTYEGDLQEVEIDGLRVRKTDAGFKITFPDHPFQWVMTPVSGNQIEIKPDKE